MKQCLLAIRRGYVILLAAFFLAQTPALPAPAQTSVAIYPIKAAGAEASLATALTALLGSQLTSSPKLRVIEEAMLKTVMERQAMNVSDACDDTTCQVEIGKLVQAQKLVTGNLAKLGPKYILSLKVVDVVSGANEFSTEDKCTCSEDQLDGLVAVAAAKLRNHFQDPVPIPALPTEAAPPVPSLSQEAPANPAAVPETHRFDGKVKPPTSGKSRLYVFVAHYNQVKGPKTVSVDGEVWGEGCLQAEIEPGNHQILVLDSAGVGKGKSGELALKAEPDQTYFVKIQKGSWISSPFTMSPLPPAEGQQELLHCFALPPRKH